MNTNTNNPSGKVPENFFISKEEVHSSDQNEPFYVMYSINCNSYAYDITEEQFQTLYDLMGKFIKTKKDVETRDRVAERLEKRQKDQAGISLTNTEINNFITKRYCKWLDYAKYHCTKAGIPNKASDILNGVILSIFTKNENDVMRLIRAKSGQYCELDFYALRLIKLNASSSTSPYRRKHRPITAD